jgi:hypothetical protein
LASPAAGKTSEGSISESAKRKRTSAAWPLFTNDLYRKDLHSLDKPRFHSDSDAVPQISRNKWSQAKSAAALQFGFHRVKEDLGRHHCKIGPEDDRSARGD